MSMINELIIKKFPLIWYQRLSKRERHFVGMFWATCPFKAKGHCKSIQGSDWSPLSIDWIFLFWIGVLPSSRMKLSLSTGYAVWCLFDEHEYYVNHILWPSHSTDLKPIKLQREILDPCVLHHQLREYLFRGLVIQSSPGDVELMQSQAVLAVFSEQFTKLFYVVFFVPSHPSIFILFVIIS